jgi:hypothetical protein
MTVWNKVINRYTESQIAYTIQDIRYTTEYWVPVKRYKIRQRWKLASWYRRKLTDKQELSYQRQRDFNKLKRENDSKNIWNLSN